MLPLALTEFLGVKRRLELLGSPGDVAVYDDFAHHPTAIATTLQGLRARAGNGRVIALVEPRSNTMRMGEHRAQLAAATAAADRVYWFQPPGMNWSLESVVAESPVAGHSGGRCGRAGAAGGERGPRGRSGSDYEQWWLWRYSPETAAAIAGRNIPMSYPF